MKVVYWLENTTFILISIAFFAAILTFTGIVVPIVYLPVAIFLSFIMGGIAEALNAFFPVDFDD